MVARVLLAGVHVGAYVDPRNAVRRRNSRGGGGGEWAGAGSQTVEGEGEGGEGGVEVAHEVKAQVRARHVGVVGHVDEVVRADVVGVVPGLSKRVPRGYVDETEPGDGGERKEQGVEGDGIRGVAHREIVRI